MDASLLPRVNAVGLREGPEGFSERPRRFPARVRFAAALLLGVFLAVVSVTTAVSLGAYCLTSDGSNTARLPSSYKGSSR